MFDKFANLFTDNEKIAAGVAAGVITGIKGT